MSLTRVDPAFSKERPLEWRHLSVGSPVHYLERLRTVTGIIPPTRTAPWSLLLAPEGNFDRHIVRYGDVSLRLLRPASY